MDSANPYVFLTYYKQKLIKINYLKTNGKHFKRKSINQYTTNIQWNKCKYMYVINNQRNTLHCAMPKYTYWEIVEPQMWICIWTLILVSFKFTYIKMKLYTNNNNILRSIITVFYSKHFKGSMSLPRCYLNFRDRKTTSP